MPDDTEALREVARALERFPSLFALSFDAIVLCDPNGMRLLGNDVAKELIGGDFNGSHFAPDVAPAALAVFTANFKIALAGESIEFESVFTRRDGEPVNVIIRLIPAFYGRRIVGVYGIARDITQRRRAESARDEIRQQFRSLFDQHPDSISMLDADGRYERINAAAERMMGFRSDEVTGRKVATFAPAGQRDALDRRVHEVIHDGLPIRYTYPFVRKDGSQGEVEGTAVPIVVRKSVTGLFLMSHDITDRVRIEEALALQARRTRALYEFASESGADEDEQVSRALAFGLKELRYESALVVTAVGEVLTIEQKAGTKLNVDARDPLLRQLCLATIAGSGLLEAGDAALTARACAAGGAPAFCRAFLGVPLESDGGRYGALVFSSRSIGVELTAFDREFVGAVSELAAASLERASEEKRLQGLAHFDALTGLANRLLLSDRFKRAIANAQRRGEELAVYFIDLDKFKAINDTHGHRVGDEVLRVVARRLLHGCRANDTVARLGGDEFIVLRSGPRNEAGPRALAVRLLADLRAPCDIEGLHLELSVGIGISLFPQDGNDERTLLESADTALYVAKASGPGSIRRAGCDTAAGNAHSPNLARRPRLDVGGLQATPSPLRRPIKAVVRVDAGAPPPAGKPIL